MRCSEKYTFVERPGNDNASVKITSGVFSGVIFSIGKVSITESDPPVLHYSFVVEETHSNMPKKLLESLPEFKNLVGDIIHDCLESHLPPE